MKKYILAVALILASANALADGVATGTTSDWPNYTTSAEACASAKSQAKSAVNDSTNYYGNVTGFGKCDCSSAQADDGTIKYICTVDAYYTEKK